MAKIKKTERVEKEPEQVGDFVLYNNEKLDRVINGSMGSNGMLINGLGKDAPQEAILAEYDRLAGLIKTRNGEKVATGSFYDFENKCARKTASVEIEKENESAGPKLNVENVSGPESEGETKKRGKKNIDEE